MSHVKNSNTPLFIGGFVVFVIICIGAYIISQQKSCKSDEEMIEGKCVIKCQDGKVLVAGICTTPAPVVAVPPGDQPGLPGVNTNSGGCLPGQEIYNGICVLKCSSNFVRNPVNGLCQSPQMVGTDTVLCAVGQELVGTTCVAKCQDGYTRVGTVCQTNTVAASGNKCTTGLIDIDGICMYKQYVIHTENEEAKDVLKKVVDLDTIKYAGDVVRVDFEVSHKNQGWGNDCSRLGLSIIATNGGKYVYNVRMENTKDYMTKTGTTIFNPPLQVVPGHKIGAVLESEGKNCAVYMKDVKMTIYIKPK